MTRRGIDVLASAALVLTRKRRRKTQDGGGGRPKTGVKIGRPRDADRKRREPRRGAVWMYLMGQMPAGEVASTAEAVISTNHVWRVGQKMLRELIKAEVLPRGSWEGEVDGTARIVFHPDKLTADDEQKIRTYLGV